jgi:hypothetical protein
MQMASLRLAVVVLRSPSKIAVLAWAERPETVVLLEARRFVTFL